MCGPYVDVSPSLTMIPSFPAYTALFVFACKKFLSIDFPYSNDSSSMVKAAIFPFFAVNPSLFHEPITLLEEFRICISPFPLLAPPNLSVPPCAYVNETYNCLSFRYIPFASPLLVRTLKIFSWSNCFMSSSASTFATFFHCAVALDAVPVYFHNILMLLP